MPSYLISFTMPGDFGLQHESQIRHMARAPETDQEVVDLQQTLGMEYGLSGVAFITWDLLPDREHHPSVAGGTFCYVISYFFQAASNAGCGSMSLLLIDPICTLSDLRSTEEYVRATNQLVRVRLMSCKAVRIASPAMRKAHEQLIADTRGDATSPLGPR